MACADHHFVDASWPCLAGFAKTGLHASLGLQFQCNVFQDVASPSAFFQALQEAATFTHTAAVFNQSGQPVCQTLVEARQGVRREVFQRANVNQRLHDRTVSPDVGTAQMGHAQKLDVFGVHE